MNPRTSAKAEAFAAALEGGSAAADPAVAALVGLAERLSSLPLRPAPDFSAALREQLVQSLGTSAGAPATVAPAAAAPAATSALPAWVTGSTSQLLTGALAVAVGVVGTGVGASRSLPGDPLYPVKGAIERLQLAFADDPVDRADALAERVRERLDEVSALLEGLTLPLDLETERLVQDTLDQLRDDLDELTALLLDEARAGSGRALAALQEFTADARMRLSALASALPAGALQDSARSAVGVVDTVAEEAADIITTTPGTGSPSPAPTGSSSSPGSTTGPTTPPTQLPTQLPSDLPTQLPTQLPSNVVPSVPTPTDIPTLLPTPLPSLPVDVDPGDLLPL